MVGVWQLIGTQADATAAIEQWGTKARPSVKSANDFVGCYKKGYKLAGQTRLATLWHAIGHKVGATATTDIAI